MQYVVRFARMAGSTGPDSVLIAAASYSESYREGKLAAYHFLDAEGEQVAMVRAEHVTYIAVAGHVAEPEIDVERFAAIEDPGTAE